MLKKMISAGRRFSLKAPIREILLEGEELVVYAMYFEAGQTLLASDGEASYQVLEGDALFRDPHSIERVSKGQILIGAPSSIENAGGGLLVVLEIRGA